MDALSPLGLPISLATHFAALPDPRVERTRAHDLLEIVTITLLAVICGADGWTQVEVFGRERLTWLRTFLRLANGAPSDDTYRRVFAALDPAAFHQCFVAWMQALVGMIAASLAMNSSGVITRCVAAVLRGYFTWYATRPSGSTDTRDRHTAGRAVYRHKRSRP